MSSPIKRAARTYGRRKPLPDEDDTLNPAADASFSSNASSNTSILSPSLYESGVEFPPSSDDLDAFDGSMTRDTDEDAEMDKAASDSDKGLSSKTRVGSGAYYSWKKQLADIDKQFDEEDAGASGHTDPLFTLSSTQPARQVPLPAPFSGSLPSSTAPSQPPASPSIARPLVKRRVLASQSESDSGHESEKEKRGSPKVLHHITTPQSGSSPTPPTSHEMPRKDKGKGKARQIIPSEEDDELPALAEKSADTKSKARRTRTLEKGKEKEKRIKPLTKKEREETQKAIARIRAGQEFSIPRADAPMPLSSLWAKIQKRAVIPHQSTSMQDKLSIPSDPIQPFSSSPTVSHPTPRPARTKARPPRTPTRSLSPQNAISFGASNLLNAAELRSPGEASHRQSLPEAFKPNGLLGKAERGLAPKVESSDEEMPDVHTLLQHDAEKRKAQEKLKEMKLRLLQQREAQQLLAMNHQEDDYGVDDDESDLEVVQDDMHVVAREEAQERRVRAKEKVGRRMALVNAGKSPVKKSGARDVIDLDDEEGFSILAAAAAPAFAPIPQLHKTPGSAKKRLGARTTTGAGKVVKVNSDQLNRVLLKASEKMSWELTKAKEDEFYKRKGQASDLFGAGGNDKGESIRMRMKEIVERGMGVAKKMEEMYEAGEAYMEEEEEEEEEGDEEDEDWDPHALGSGAEDEDEENDENQAIGSDSNEGENENDENEDKGFGALSENDENEYPATTEDDMDLEPSEKENRPRVTRTFARPRRAFTVLDSDDEAGPSDAHSPSPSAFGRVLVPDTSLIFSPTPSTAQRFAAILDSPPLPPTLGLGLGPHDGLGSGGEAYRGYISSSSERPEDGTDKENDMRLMWDRGEDKENTTVAHTLSFNLSPTGSLRRGGGGSFLDDERRASSSRDILLGGDEERTPLKDLEADDEEDSFFSPSAKARASGSRRMSRQGTPRGLSSQELSPLLLRSGGSGKRHGGFSQFFATQDGFSDTVAQTNGKVKAGEEGEGEALLSGLQPAALIRPGFSQLFDDGSQAFGSPSKGRGIMGLDKNKGGLSQFFATQASDANGLDSLRRLGDAEELSLTLDTKAQHGRLDVDESIIRKADSIFEKEQEYLVEGAMKKSSGISKLFEDENSLTQSTSTPRRRTLFGVVSPSSQLIASVPSTSSPTMPLTLPSALRSQSRHSIGGPSPSFPRGSQRQPLGPLPIANDDDDDDLGLERPRLGRLRRRGETPRSSGFSVRDGYRSSPSPSPTKPRNAFDVLGKKPQLKAPLFDKRTSNGKGKEKLGKSEFIEGEAEESDEDNGFSWGLPKNKVKDDEEEEEDEDQDGELKELMDDQEMDADALNEDKVLEKVQEHQKEDDDALERVHMNAVQGKYRIKRRDRGLGFDDSDSEIDEDDYEARRRRGKIAKKRRIDGDTLEELAKNEATQAFVAAYHADDDDDLDFAHLREQRESLNLDLPHRSESQGRESDEDENQKPMYMNRAELEDEIRKAARGDIAVDTFEPHDLSWIEGDDMDDDGDASIHIREVPRESKKSDRQTTSSAMTWDYMQPSREGSTQDLARAQKWARSEGGARNAGTGRSVGTATISGIARSAKSGGGSIAQRSTVGRKGTSSGVSASTSSGTNSQNGGRRVKKAASALLVVGNRRDKFRS